MRTVGAAPLLAIDVDGPAQSGHDPVADRGGGTRFRLPRRGSKKKGSKIRARAAAGIPLPESATSMRAQPASSVPGENADLVVGRCAGRRGLRRVEEQVDHRLPNLPLLHQDLGQGSSWSSRPERRWISAWARVMAERISGTGSTSMRRPSGGGPRSAGRGRCRGPGGRPGSPRPPPPPPPSRRGGARAPWRASPPRRPGWR